MAYFDFAANPPVDQRVLDTYYKTTQEFYANPNSFHALGLASKHKLDEASAHIAKLMGCDKDDIIYTSGATEANNLAIKGVCERYKNRGKHILISSLEHNSITASVTALTKQGFEVELIPLDRDGRVDIDELQDLLREDTILVSIVAVDSELAIRQDIESLAHYVKEHSQAFMHVDASQAIGKCHIDFSECDLITLTPHKFYGINGTGALIKRSNVSLIAQIDGGRSTTIYRSGTPVVANVVAFDKALTLALNEEDERTQKITAYHDDLLSFIKNYKHIHINTTKYSLPHIINFSITDITNARFADSLEKHQVYVSAKTSCCPANMPSKLVFALTHNKALALNSVRVSISHLNSVDDIAVFKQAFDLAYKETFHE